MWFDPHTKLAEIKAQAPVLGAASQLSQVSRDPVALNPAPHVATVAVAATPQRPKLESFPYGTACGLGDSPRTWTGRIVSRDEWTRLTVWEKHGPNGRHWNGITMIWEHPSII